MVAKAGMIRFGSITSSVGGNPKIYVDRSNERGRYRYTVIGPNEKRKENAVRGCVYTLESRTLPRHPHRPNRPKKRGSSVSTLVSMFTVALALGRFEISMFGRGGGGRGGGVLNTSPVLLMRSCMVGRVFDG